MLNIDILNGIRPRFLHYGIPGEGSNLDCNGVAIPTVDESALPCDGLIISTDCITTTKAYNFFGIGIGEYLTNAFTKITDKVKLISNLVNINTQAISDEIARATAAELVLTNLLSGVATTTTKVSLTTNQIKSLGSTSVVLLPAPGVGKTYDVLSVMIKTNFNTVPFNSTIDDLHIRYSTANTSLYNSVNLVNQTGDYIQYLDLGYSNPNSAQITVNDDLEIYNLSNATLGDGSMDIYITYKIITL